MRMKENLRNLPTVLDCECAMSSVLAAGPKGAKSTKHTQSCMSVVVVALLLPLFVRLRLRLKLPFYFSEPMVYCPVNWQRETDRDRDRQTWQAKK